MKMKWRDKTQTQTNHKNKKPRGAGNESQVSGIGNCHAFLGPHQLFFLRPSRLNLTLYLRTLLFSTNIDLLISLIQY